MCSQVLVSFSIWRCRNTIIPINTSTSERLVKTVTRRPSLYYPLFYPQWLQVIGQLSFRKILDSPLYIYIYIYIYIFKYIQLIQLRLSFRNLKSKTWDQEGSWDSAVRFPVNDYFGQGWLIDTERKIRLTHNHQVNFCSRTVNFREVRQVATGDIENRLADIDLLSIDNLFRKNNIV